MLMTTQANRYAHALMKAREDGSLLPKLSRSEPLNLDDAYDIARSILTIRIAQGEHPIGRKIAFSPLKAAPQQDDSAPGYVPFWSTLFDSSVEYAMGNSALHSLTKAQLARVEAKLVFKLGRTPEPDITLEGMADCLEWMAHGFEVVVSPFKNWEFEAADAVAAFGLHRKLIIGEPRMLSRQSRHNLSKVLSSASLSLSRSVAGTSGICAAGFGNTLMDSPLHALLALHQQLQQQEAFTPLQAGEIIATGSWTRSLPVKRGEVWSSAFCQLNLPGLNLSFS